MEELQKALTHLQSDVPRLRSLALDAIGTLNPDNALEVILPFLNDADANVRDTAAFNLGDIHNPNSVPYLIAFCSREPNRVERGFGFTALGEYHHPTIKDFYIQEVYKQKQPRVPRQQMATQLRHYPSEETVKTLMFLFQNDDDTFVREDAAESLLHLNPPDLSDFWTQQRLSSSPIICKIANTALGVQDE